ncbi:MAG: hypothetical protein IJZ23_06880 [Roseburia sp.]|nr:hypothetical protein [Roseburia sp.]MBQ8279549.1 hypothetical protein [Roseburia sp.]
MRKSGITSTTPNDFILNAGVVFKNFKWKWKLATGENPTGITIVADTEAEDESTIHLSKVKNPGVSFIALDESYTEPKVGDVIVGAWDDAAENVLGATSGGNKLSIMSEITQIEVDGALVKVKGLTQKQGETGSLETNLAQHTKESFIRSIIGKEQESLIKGYTQLTTKALIEASDYLDNIAYVGTMSDGKECIVIMENALCTSGFELESKNKETAVLKAVFECNADFDDAHDTLPIYIFVPNKETA